MFSLTTVALLRAQFTDSTWHVWLQAMCGQFGLGFRAGIYDDVRQFSLKMCIAHIKSMCLSLVSWACNPGGVLKKGVRHERKTKQYQTGMRWHEGEFS